MMSLQCANVNYQYTSTSVVLTSTSTQTGGTYFILEEKITPRFIIIFNVRNVLIGAFRGPRCWFKATQHPPCTSVNPHAHQKKFSPMRGPFRPPHPGKIWHGFPPLLRSEINKLSLLQKICKYYRKYTTTSYYLTSHLYRRHIFIEPNNMVW